MSGASLHRHPDAVPDLADVWQAATRDAPYLGQGLDDYRLQIEGREDDLCRILALPGDDGPMILPCTLAREPYKFTIGERTLARAHPRVLHLVNNWLAEAHSPETIARALRLLMAQSDADLLSLGEIPEASRLATALGKLPWSARPMTRGRKENLRWLIDLPESFEAYLQGLSSSTRQSTKRKIRKLEKDHDVTVEVITDAADVPRFLEEGEKISRLTYQWNVGQRLVDDAETRRRFERLAADGRLRCYLLTLDGTPRAFLRGTIENGTLYNYETPGFDPAFRKHSIGMILMLYAVEDLIANTPVTVFDFGVGGDEVGYKSTYGNRHYTCNSYVVARLNRPRGAAIWLAQGLLNGAKNAADLLLRHQGLRQFVKRRLRKYGS